MNTFGTFDTIDVSITHPIQSTYIYIHMYEMITRKRNIKMNESREWKIETHFNWFQIRTSFVHILSFVCARMCVCVLACVYKKVSNIFSPKVNVHQHRNAFEHFSRWIFSLLHHYSFFFVAVVVLKLLFFLKLQIILIYMKQIYSFWARLH